MENTQDNRAGHVRDTCPACTPSLRPGPSLWRADGQVREYLHAHAGRLEDEARVCEELTALVLAVTGGEAANIRVSCDLPRRWAYVDMPQGVDLASVADHISDVSVYWVRRAHRAPEPEAGRVILPVVLTYLRVHDLQSRTT